jgi:hypothetical protein
MLDETTLRFPFRFDVRFRLPLSVLGIRPATCQVAVCDERLEVHYGPWHLTTPWSNVIDARVSGPFKALFAVGPRLSLTDRGATFGTSARGGVCFRFHEPVGALLGEDRLRHPGLTVTVEDAERLVAAVDERRRRTS